MKKNKLELSKISKTKPGYMTKNLESIKWRQNEKSEENRYKKYYEG